MSSGGILVHGGVDLSGGAIDDLPGVTVYTDTKGFSTGSPQPLTEALPRLLLDGEEVTGDRSSNRSLTYSIEVKAPTKALLDQFEDLYAAVVDSAASSFLWKPDGPGGLGATTVFEAFRGKMAQRFDDGWDQAEAVFLRRYDLEVPALPFARALDRTVVDGLIVDPVGSSSVIDSCDAATGWSAGTRAVSATTDSFLTAPMALKAASELDGAWTASYNYDAHTITGTFTATFQKTFAPVSMTGTKYLSFWAIGHTGSLSAGPVTVDGTPCLPRGSFAEKNAAGDWGVRFVFECPVASWTTIQIAMTTSQVYPWDSPPLRMAVIVDDLKRSNQPPAATTGYQGVWSIPVDGSMRTPGSLEIKHASSALGDVMVLTYDDLGNGMRPDLRRLRTGGPATSASSTVVSGATELLSSSATGAFTARIPVSSLRPGSYMLLARTRVSSSPATITISATAGTYFGTTLVGTLSTISAATAYPSTNYQINQIGLFHLPTRKTRSGAAAEVEIQLWTPGVSTVTLDEVWLVPLDAVTTRVPCGTSAPAAGGSSSKLFIDSPTVSDRYGGVWVGTQADGSDARTAGPELSALGRHIFRPSKTVVFVVCTNAKGYSVALSYHARSHSNRGA